MAAIYRAPMSARTLDLPPGKGAAYGLAHDLVGIGEPLQAEPADLDEAIFALAHEHGEKAGRLLRRFAEAQPGSFAWTRTPDGAYWLGRVTGPWRYDNSAQARRTGLCHTRRATWLERPFGEDAVPTAVTQTFARGGRNFQRTHHELAERQTAVLWDEASTDGRQCDCRRLPAGRPEARSPNR